MNIENLTFGELKQIAAMFPQLAQPQPPTSTPNPMVGLYCIARCYAAGVHAGTVISVDGENVILANSHRLWSWEANDGVALSGLAQSGLKKGKIDTPNPLIYLTGVCELIPCSKLAQETIHA